MLLVKSLEVAGQVSGILGLLALLGVLGAYVKYWSLRSEERKLNSLAEEQRTDAYLNRANKWGLPVENLPAGSVENIVIEQLRTKERTSKWRGIIGAVVFLSSLGVYANSPKLPPPTTPTVRESYIDYNEHVYVSISFAMFPATDYTEVLAEVSDKENFKPVLDTALIGNWKNGKSSFIFSSISVQSETPLYLRFRASKGETIRYSDHVRFIPK